MRSVVSVLLLVLLPIGCSDLGPSDINGKWARDLSQVESSWEINLRVSGSTVSGTGSWYGEACCSGDLSATGSVSGLAVHLDIASTRSFPPGPVAISHFDGKLVTSKLLQGTIRYDQDPPSEGTSFILHRQ